MKAVAELRQTFGDVAEAHDVIVRLADLLARIDTVETDGAAQTSTKTKTSNADPPTEQGGTGRHREAVVTTRDESSRTRPAGRET